MGTDNKHHSLIGKGANPPLARSWLSPTADLPIGEIRHALAAIQTPRRQCGTLFIRVLTGQATSPAVMVPEKALRIVEAQGRVSKAKPTHVTNFQTGC